MTMISTDETSAIRGHQYVTIFMDPKGKNVIHFIKGKDSSTWADCKKCLEAHGGSAEKGINPSFAIGNILGAIHEFTLPEKNKGLILCTVVQIDVGEKAFGIAASKGDLRMTIRALYEEELDRLQENLENFAKVQAEEFDLKISFQYNDEFPETFNHKESADKIRLVAKAKGMELVEVKEAFRASEDFGHFTKLTKGAFCFIGNGVDYPSIHTYEYDFRDELIESGVELFKGLAE